MRRSRGSSVSCAERPLFDVFLGSASNFMKGREKPLNLP
jgi:hypothetical protein